MPVTHKEISDLLSRIYFLRYEEKASILVRCKNVPPEGLKKLKDILNDGLLMQDHLLRRIFEEHPNFGEKLRVFMKKTFARLAKKYEAQEQKNVDAIFDPTES